MNSRGAVVLFIVLLAFALYFLMGYRAQRALERAVCGASRRFVGAPETFRATQGSHEYLGDEYLDDHACHMLRNTDARFALQVAWWTWPWTFGKSDEDLMANFDKHFVSTSVTYIPYSRSARGAA